MDYQKFLETSLFEAAEIANESFGKVTGSIKGEGTTGDYSQTSCLIDL